MAKRVSLPPKLPPRLPPQNRVDGAIHGTWESLMDTAKKNPMMLATTAMIMLFSAFNADQNAADWQAHPGACIVGSMIPGAVIGIVWFAFRHKKGNKK